MVERQAVLNFVRSLRREEYDPFHSSDLGDVLYYVLLFAKCAAGGDVIFAVRHRLLQLSYVTAIGLYIVSVYSMCLGSRVAAPATV